MADSQANFQRVGAIATASGRADARKMFDKYLIFIVLTAMLSLALPRHARADEPTPAPETPAAAEKAPDAAAETPKAADAKPAEPEKKSGSLLQQMDDANDKGEAVQVPAPPPEPRFPFVEYHGYFRFRPDMIGNGHLGMAVASSLPQIPVVTTSSILPPLSRWPKNNAGDYASQVGNSRDESMISGANMRVRLMPTLHLSDSIRIVTTMDLLDNHVFGAAPDYAGYQARPDVPLVAFATSTKPGAIAIKEAYGEWKTAIGLFRIGRQASQWGLGILANGGGGDGWEGSRPTEYFGGPRRPSAGNGLDGDFGSYADRLAFVTKAYGTYVSLFWDFASAGVVGYDPTRVDGQIRDLDRQDDVNQWGFALFQKPISADDAIARRKLLIDEAKGVFDWGIYGVYRKQDSDSQGTVAPSTLSLDDINDQKKSIGFTFVPRNAWAAIADVWGRYEQYLFPRKRIVIEGEFSLVRGKIGDANSVPGNVPIVRDIQLWGGAIKAAYQDEGIGVYLDIGAASGDDTNCFGVYGDGTCNLATIDGKPNQQITGFKFNKNYRVDSLLFREIIGSVTNAIYIKPTFSLNAYPFTSPQLLGVDVSAMYARAMVKEGTPGNAYGLGEELGLKAFMGQRDLYHVSINFAYAITGDALNLTEGWHGATAPKIADSPWAKIAENAWRLTGVVGLMF